MTAMDNDPDDAGTMPPWSHGEAEATPARGSILQVTPDARYTHGLFFCRPAGSERDEVLRTPFVGWGVEVIFSDPGIGLYSTRVTCLFRDDQFRIVSRDVLVEETGWKFARLIEVEPGGLS